MLTVCVTGHRPNKLYGYDMTDPRYIAIKDFMKEFLKMKECTEVYTGMALGIDQLFAEAVIELKDEGYQIELNCAIPCKNHSCKWPLASQKHYGEILEKADNIILVSDKEYSPYLMQLRNEYMVDKSDEVLAIWDGSDGGTGNCVRYANKVGKKVTVVIPSSYYSAVGYLDQIKL